MKYLTLILASLLALTGCGEMVDLETNAILLKANKMCDPGQYDTEIESGRALKVVFDPHVVRKTYFIFNLGFDDEIELFRYSLGDESISFLSERSIIMPDDTKLKAFTEIEARGTLVSCVDKFPAADAGIYGPRTFLVEKVLFKEVVNETTFTINSDFITTKKIGNGSSYDIDFGFYIGNSGGGELLDELYDDVIANSESADNCPRYSSLFIEISSLDVCTPMYSLTFLLDYFSPDVSEYNESVTNESYKILLTDFEKLNSL